MKLNEVKLLHFSDEDERDYRKEKKNMIAGIIVGIVCVITFIGTCIISNENLTTYQFRCKQGLRFFSGIGIVISIITFFYTRNNMKEIENKY